MESVRKDLDELLDREEAMWKQRAKTQWLKEGDRNTQFFHAQAFKRAKRNEIRGLRDHSGDMQNTIEGMCYINCYRLFTVYLYYSLTIRGGD